MVDQTHQLVVLIYPIYAQIALNKSGPKALTRKYAQVKGLHDILSQQSGRHYFHYEDMLLTVLHEVRPRYRPKVRK